MANRDFYKILGVDEKAGSETIKKAYRKLAKENHPDTHPGDKAAEEKFKEISEAYNVLSDPKKRQQYDRMRKYGFASGQPGAGSYQQGLDFDLSDLFGGSFSGGRRRSSRQGDFNLDDFFGFGGLGDLFSQIFEKENGYAATRNKKGQDIHANLNISFETAVHGGKTVFSVNKDITCSSCGGNGAKGGQQPEICPECHGSGMVSMARGAFALNRPCPRCFGKGKIIREPCPDCRGTGHQYGVKKYSLNIAPGAEDGKKLRMKGEGKPGMNGEAPGDLIVTIRVAKHKFFRNVGFDIYCEIPIDKKKAKKGTKVRVKTVHGNMVELNIPANTTEEKTFRLKGMGIKNKGVKGDQYVKIKLK